MIQLACDKSISKVPSYHERSLDWLTNFKVRTVLTLLARISALRSQSFSDPSFHQRGIALSLKMTLGSSSVYE